MAGHADSAQAHHTKRCLRSDDGDAVASRAGARAPAREAAGVTPRAQALSWLEQRGRGCGSALGCARNLPWACRRGVQRSSQPERQRLCAAPRRAELAAVGNGAGHGVGGWVGERLGGRLDVQAEPQRRTARRAARHPSDTG